MKKAVQTVAKITICVAVCAALLAFTILHSFAYVGTYTLQIPYAQFADGSVYNALIIQSQNSDTSAREYIYEDEYHIWDVVPDSPSYYRIGYNMTPSVPFFDETVSVDSYLQEIGIDFTMPVKLDNNLTSSGDLDDVDMYATFGNPGIIDVVIRVNGGEWQVISSSAEITQWNVEIGYEYAEYIVTGVLVIDFVANDNVISVSKGSTIDLDVVIWGQHYMWNTPYDSMFQMYAGYYSAYFTFGFDRPDESLTGPEQDQISSAQLQNNAAHDKADAIGSADANLESALPEYSDPFANAPDPGVYQQGFGFFPQLFTYFYTNQIIGAFISFSLIMALVVFIMRR